MRKAGRVYEVSVKLPQIAFSICVDKHFSSPNLRGRLVTDPLRGLRLAQHYQFERSSGHQENAICRVFIQS